MPRRLVVMPLLLAGIGLSALLTGCRAELEAELRVGDIRDREIRGLFATSHVATDDCDRGPHSNVREGSAGWTGWVLSGVFPDTRYRSCRETGSGAEATFRNMFVLDATPGEALGGLSHVNVKWHERTLAVGLPAYVQGNIERVRGLTGLDDNPRITTRLTLVNDADEAVVYRQARYEEAGAVGWGESRLLEAGTRVSLDYPAALAERVLTDGRAPLLRIEPGDRTVFTDPGVPIRVGGLR